MSSGDPLEWQITQFLAIVNRQGERQERPRRGRRQDHVDDFSHPAGRFS